MMYKCPQCGYEPTPCFYCDEPSVIRGTATRWDSSVGWYLEPPISDVPVCKGCIWHLIEFQKMTKEEKTEFLTALDKAERSIVRVGLLMKSLQESE